MYRRTMVALALMLTLILALFLVLLAAVSEAAPRKPRSTPAPRAVADQTPGAQSCTQQGEFVELVARGRDLGMSLSS